MDFYTENGDFSVLKKVSSKELNDNISSLALKAFTVVKGKFYGRVDIRMDRKTEQLMVLEVNSYPGLQSPSSTDDLMKLYGVDFKDFLREALNINF